ncbi:MAG TPA: VOC family protein [Pyrinomonadaceae bacterium]|jgi:PhnB protein|nr:VOC family protein [Pyrinomonadaceae bacterium]
MSTPQKKVNPIPADYAGITPYLSVKGAADAIEFYKKAFGATELMRLPGPNGTLGHAEIKIGNALVMLADEFPEYGNLSPKTLGGSAVRLHMYVEDVDAFFEKAVAAGAKVLIPVADQFYGDRSGRLEDPFGHVWLVSTHVEDVEPGEMERRMKEFSKS